MAVVDDLPWPDLEMVSRGGTRGNLGQKGVLGPADSQGRCILQLRVQRDVLPVRLNRQASEWYRTLEIEVTRAQNLTKTYWRKARRRQDYDARADQDHMELHEWLQQLKDKTMSHIEVLMDKGSIQGPPYAMADHIELTFLRKFIQRQSACIPHNPRLRGEHAFPVPQDFEAAETAGTYVEQNPLDLPPHSPPPSQSHESESVADAANSALMTARFEHACAQRQKVDALLAYRQCLQTQYEAALAVKMAEKQRDELLRVATLPHVTQSSQGVEMGREIIPVRELETFGQHTDRALEIPVSNPHIDKDIVAAARVLETFQNWAHDEDLANEMPLHQRKRRHFDNYDQEAELRARIKRGAFHQLNLGGDHGSNRLVHAIPDDVYHNPGHREDLGFTHLQRTHPEEDEDADGEAETDSDGADWGVARFQEYTPRRDYNSVHQPQGAG
ncbi:hypothetical protein C8R45DRAFT_1012364 [Mycena sanguinolenta]|nr:hypothetical protein C8R45DRAFT_1012364 [Mycena sanguinolenta]